MPAPRTIPFDYPMPGTGPAPALPGAGLPWLDALRDEGRRLSANGLPSTRTEAWKYTSLAPLTELDFSTPTLGAEVFPADHTGDRKVVFQAAGEVPYQDVISLLDRLKALGVEAFGIR